MKYLIAFILLLGFWLLLTFEITVQNIITGAAATVITILFFKKYIVNPGIKLVQPARYFWLMLYFFIFLWECIKANFDVAYRVLHPGMPIKPGIVKVKLKVRSAIGKTMLANSITMTPGTISVDLIDDELYVHWIYVRDQDPDKYSQKVAGRFERYIIKIFD